MSKYVLDVINVFFYSYKDPNLLIFNHARQLILVNKKLAWKQNWEFYNSKGFLLVQYLVFLRL